MAIIQIFSHNKKPEKMDATVIDIFCQSKATWSTAIFKKIVKIPDHVGQFAAPPLGQWVPPTPSGAPWCSLLLSLAASPCPLPSQIPVVPQPGWPLAPSPSSDQRNCFYFGVEDLEPPESSAATWSEPQSSQSYVSCCGCQHSSFCPTSGGQVEATDCDGNRPPGCG